MIKDPIKGAYWDQPMGYAATQQRERRRHRRYGVRGVSGILVLPMRVEVLNMSLTGLAAESRKPLEIGRKYDLKLHNGRETIDVNVDVQWCHLVRTERTGTGDVVPIYQAGLDFRHVLSDQARELLGFLEHNVVVDVERRITGRFKIGLDEPIGLDARHDFRVRQLSFSGMLIETEVAPEIGAAFDMEMGPDMLHLKTRGKVFHAEPLLGASCCQAGIQFLQVSPESRLTLERLIEGLLE